MRIVASTKDLKLQSVLPTKEQEEGSEEEETSACFVTNQYEIYMGREPFWSLSPVFF